MRRKKDDHSREDFCLRNESQIVDFLKDTRIAPPSSPRKTQKESKRRTETAASRSKSLRSEQDSLEEEKQHELARKISNLGSKKIPKSRVPQFANFKNFTSIKPDTIIYDFTLHELSDDEKLIAVLVKNEVHFFQYRKGASAPSEHLRPFRTIEITFENQSQKDEEYLYSCDFGFFFRTRQETSKTRSAVEEEDQTQADLVLCAGGKAGSLFVLFVFEKEIIEMKSNHNDIYCIRFPTKNSVFDHRNLVLCSYKDSMVILWNIEAQVQVANFIPFQGPFMDITSVAWHKSHEFFATGGIDGCITFWTVEKEVIKLIDFCLNEFDSKKNKPSSFPTMRHTSNYSKIFDVHDNYVDDIHFFGDLIISRDVEQNIALWHPIISQETHFTLKQWNYYMYELIYFTKMSVNQEKGLLILGNDVGEVLFCALDPQHERKIGSDKEETNMPFCKMSLTNEQVVVRKAILSKGLDVIFCISDSGKLWFEAFDSAAFGKFM